MVDVVGNPRLDAAGGGGPECAEDDRLGVAVEPQVVERHLQRRRGGGEERGHVVRDVTCGLTAVGEGLYLQHGSARGDRPQDDPRAARMAALAVGMKH